MKQQEQINYDRIAEAIDYIRDHFQSQPSLEEVADKIHLSPYHFQRLFTDWAGVSPKKFLQYISVEHAKEVLKDQRATVYDAAFETGLSGTGRLHDLFVNIEGMTPGEFRNGGADLEINYSFAESPFGACSSLPPPKASAIWLLWMKPRLPASPQPLPICVPVFPMPGCGRVTDLIQQNALYIFTQDWSRLSEVKLHLKGTDFQLKVWETLLKIPMGGLSTYKDIAGRLGNSQASRAVGSAVGDNPVAFLIPCHRVIQSTGIIGQYHWGATRKAAMIGWEAARTVKTA